MVWSGNGVTYTISIHALREEGDVTRRVPLTLTLYFYPRPPRGGRRMMEALAAMPRRISIHALREEGDRRGGQAGEQVHTISIHALREEGDRSHRRRSGLSRNFYPRPPRGGRLMML